MQYDGYKILGLIIVITQETKVYTILIYISNKHNYI